MVKLKAKSAGSNKKDPDKLKRYWTKMVLSGKGSKLQVIGDDAAVRDWVATNPNGIGFIDDSLIDTSVKILYQVE